MSINLTDTEAQCCGDAFRLLVSHITELEKVYEAAQALVTYYRKSLDVGPGKHPKRETKLWLELKASMESVKLNSKET
jgi:hypothetical protein